MQVAAREVGALPLSIGTSLAIEELLKEPKNWPSELWINIRTVIRNLVGALDSTVRNRLLGQDVFPTLEAELLFLIEHLNTETRGKTKVVFYHCSYSDLRIKFPVAILKEHKTPNQLDALALETTCLDILFKRTSVPIVKYQTDISGSRVAALMISHLPVDLLSYEKFLSLKLLESHTGVIKERANWNTKLTSTGDSVRIPFNYLTVQVFGDKNNHFTAMPISIKKTLIALADQYRWTTVTNIATISTHVKSIPDVVVRDFITKILRA